MADAKTIDVRKEEFTRRAQLVRLYEANSAIAHPTDKDLEFRLGLMNALNSEYELRIRGGQR